MRRYAVLAHRTLALVLGAWILFQSATGFVLVFADQINARSRPELYRHGRGDAHRPPPRVATTSKDRGGRPLDADAAVRILHTQHPGAQTRLLWEALALAVGVLGASGFGMNRLRRRLRRRPATRWQRQIRRRRLIAKRQRRARRGGWPGRPKRRRAGRRPCLTAPSRPLP